MPTSRPFDYTCAEPQSRKYLGALSHKRDEARYHIDRLTNAQADIATLFPGRNEISAGEILIALNAEVNSAIHTLRTMFDTLGKLVATEKHLSMGQRYYLHDVKDQLNSGSTLRVALESLINATEYLRDFDNFTKHERLVRTGEVEEFDLVEKSAVRMFPVDAFQQGNRAHPLRGDAVVLVGESFDIVVEGICDALEAM